MPKARATARAPVGPRWRMPRPTRSRLSGCAGGGGDAGHQVGGRQGGEALERGELLHRQRVEVGRVDDQPGRRPAGRPAPRPAPRCPWRSGRRSGRCAARAAPGSRCWCSRCRSRPRGAPAAARRTGTTVGNFHLGLRRLGTPGPASTGPTISGMTSPALRTMTTSPGRTSLARTWSSLCSVATLDRGAPDEDGLQCGRTGVARPVRPIDTMMPSSLVVRSSGGNLKAMAQRGAREVAPSRACRAEVVDLGHHAVDLVGQVVPLLGQFAAAGDHGVDPGHRSGRRG